MQNAEGVSAHISQLQKRLLQSVSLFYERAKARVELAINSRVFKDPTLLTQEKEQRLDDLTLSLENALEKQLAQTESRLELLSQKLQALSPFSVLGRGYSITRNSEGKIISHVNQIQEQELIFVQVKDGMIRAEVK